MHPKAGFREAPHFGATLWCRDKTEPRGLSKSMWIVYAPQSEKNSGSGDIHFVTWDSLSPWDQSENLKVETSMENCAGIHASLLTSVPWEKKEDDELSGF